MYLTHDKAVWYDDDEQRQSVDRHDVEQVVGEFVRRRREEVKRHTLSEPREVRVVLHVEYYTLQIETKKFSVKHWQSKVRDQE